MVIANFTNEQDARVTGLDQYDYGQVLRIQGLKLPTAVEIHFGLEETGGTTTTRIGVTKDGVTDVVIPDSMLENGDTSLDYTIYAFIYLTDDTSGKTVHRIKMQVNARSKPEQFDRPSDTELFREAIKAVNQSAKEAEGWAHGREDMPERATDNAKYYAESVKGVEQNVKDMVATIGGIEQQVQDVKKFAGQAQSASEKALLSEQEAKKSEQASLQHRTGAETAENNAELAEQNAKKSEQAVEQAKTLVIQMGQQVLDNKNHVDGKVEAFNKVATDASDAINTKKTESLTEIETAKTNAVGAVGTKGTEQAKKVEDEGTKQIGAVNTEAQKHLKAMQEAVNGIVADRQQITQNKEDVTTLKEDLKGFVPKQQGAENNGKILGIGVDGVVTPVEKPSGGTGGETWRVIKEFTIPQDPNLEPSDVKYLVSDDGRITQFGVASDSENKPLELKKVFFHINKPTPFYDFASLTNILFRYNTFTGNYNLLQFYRHLKQETRILIGEIEKIGKYIKATASTFRVTTDYSWSSDTEKNVYVYNDIPENENITEICVSIFESANIKPDFRGATVTVLGVDA